MEAITHIIVNFAIMPKLTFIKRSGIIIRLKQKNKALVNLCKAI